MKRLFCVTIASFLFVYMFAAQYYKSYFKMVNTGSYIIYLYDDYTAHIGSYLSKSYTDKKMTLRDYYIYNDDVYWITEINNDFFESVTYNVLDTLILPKRLVKIGENAFKGCGLRHITWPETSLTYIGANALAGSFEIPNLDADTVYLGFHSLYVNKDSVFFTKNILTDGPVFNKVKYYEVDEENPYICSYMGAVYDKQMKKLIAYPILQDSVILYDQTEIIGASSLLWYGSPSAVSYDKTKLVLPNTIKKIESRAFEDAWFSSIEMSQNIDTICSGAFFHTTGFDTLIIRDNIGCIESYAFNQCGIKTLIFEGRVKTMGDYAFYYCSSLATLHMPETINDCGKYIFDGASKLKSVLIPNTYSKINEGMFSYCGLESIVIPSTIDIIESNAFSYCTHLKKIKMQRESPPSTGDNVFKNVDIETPLFVPCGAKNSYASVKTFKTFQNIEEDIKYNVNIIDNKKGRIEIIQAPDCSNDTLKVKALPNYGYVFKSWVNGDTSQILKIKIVEDIDIEADYSLRKFSVSVKYDTTQGKIDGEGEYEYLSSVKLNAIPNEHYHFVQWSDGVKSNPRTITVVRDTIYSAFFAIDHFIISVVAENGTVTGVGTYDYGTEITLTATPDKGYKFVDWSNGITDNPYTFIVEQDVDLTANFKKVDTGWQDIHSGIKATKFLHNGNLVIDRNGKHYSAMGERIR